MKRTREEEEEEAREMVLVDHITETLSPEMAQEVFHAMHIASDEYPDWHLNSVAVVSHLLYDSIKEVARQHFKRLVKETRIEMEEWHGVLPGRPLSIYERFPTSIPGRMGLSFPWCMFQFYYSSHQLAPNAIRSMFENGLNEATFADEADKETLFRFFLWFAGEPIAYPGSEPEEQQPPRGIVSPLKFYSTLRFVPFPDSLHSILERIQFPDFLNTRYPNNEVRFRRAMTWAILYGLLVNGKSHATLFTDWYMVFHGLSAHYTAQQIRLVFYGVIKHLFGLSIDSLTYLNDVDIRLLCIFLVLDIPLSHSVAIQLDLTHLDDETDVGVVTKIDTFHFRHSSSHYKKWLASPRPSSVSLEMQWVTKVFREFFGTIQHYATFVIQTYPEPLGPIWARLAALPHRPGDPAPSWRFQEVIDAHANV